MARLYLLALATLSEYGLDAAHIRRTAYEAVRTNKYGGGSVRQVINNAHGHINWRELEREGGIPAAMMKLIKVIHAVEEAEGGEGDLIDTIVECLNLPYASNILSRQMDKLKAAILLPKEAVELKIALREKAKKCITCSHQFQNGEMLTIQGSGELVCTRCALPSSMSCPTCEEGYSRIVRTSYLKRGVKHCDTCAVKKDPTKKVEEARPEVAGPAVPEDAPFGRIRFGEPAPATPRYRTPERPVFMTPRRLRDAAAIYGGPLNLIGEAPAAPEAPPVEDIPVGEDHNFGEQGE
jgi:hypothetical protein